MGRALLHDDRIMIDLADRFADAALDGQGWVPALRRFAEATGSARGQLIGIGGPAAVPFNLINDFSDTQLDSWMEIDGANPRTNYRIASSLTARTMEMRWEPHYRAVRHDLESDIYVDFCRDMEIPHGCQTKLVEGDSGMIGLALLRNERDGPTRTRDRALFAAVAPHVRSAVRMQVALESRGLDLVRGALDAVAAAVFVCGANGVVRATTPAADALLASGRLRLTPERRLASTLVSDTRMLHAAIAAQGRSPQATHRTLAIGSAAGALPLVLDVCALPRRDWNLAFQPKILVIARTARQWHGSAAPILGTLYGLSAAEADVSLRLARGESREAIAEARGARLETIRAQLKSAFAKLGVRREVELAAMLGQLLQI